MTTTLYLEVDIASQFLDELELEAQVGNRVIITRDGIPKAELVSESMPPCELVDILSIETRQEPMAPSDIADFLRWQQTTAKRIGRSVLFV